MKTVTEIRYVCEVCDWVYEKTDEAQRCEEGAHVVCAACQRPRPLHHRFCVYDGTPLAQTVVPVKG